MQIVSNANCGVSRTDMMSSAATTSFLSGHLMSRLENPSPTPSSTSAKSSSNDEIRDLNCPLCSTVLHSQKDFTSHIRAHNEVKPLPDPNDPTGQAKVYFCCLCRKMLSSFSSLDRHMLVHSGERPFSCEKCGQTFTTNGNMHRHKRTHGNRDSNERDGTGRGRSYNGPGRKRKSSVDSTKKEPLKKEITTTAAAATAAAAAAAAASTSLVSTVPLTQFPCPICKDTIYSEFALETHLNAFHSGIEIPCDECSNVFPAYSYLKLHKSICHRKSLFSLSAQLQMAATAIAEQQVKPVKSERVTPNTTTSAATSATSTTVLDLSSSTTTTPTKVSENNLEEQMADENDHLIREMKLKGEFPCRLCPAVYPNLRALKGHNKEHLNKAPYVCNVGTCTYSSTDKSTLARHMRSHTGEKPFECKICNFGFTTKANCERHVKNKHAKSTREEIRESIVLHESEETPGISANTSTATATTARFLNGSNNNNNAIEKDEELQQLPQQQEIKPPKSQKSEAPVFFAPYSASLFRPVEQVSNKEEVDDESGGREDGRGDVEDDYGDDDDDDMGKDETPLDLSRPTPKKPKIEKSPFFPIDLTKPGKVSPQDTSALLSTPPAPVIGHVPAALPFFFSHLANGTKTPTTMMTETTTTPTSSSSTFDFASYLLAQQEILRRQREATAAAAAAATVDPALLLRHLTHLQAMVPNVESSLSPSSPEKSSFSSVNGISSAENIDNEDNSADYKMVIKNGVLMKKQKQRRYRTERPYGCDHCNAKFTLRSNMERHIKQQHPEISSTSSKKNTMDTTKETKGGGGGGGEEEDEEEEDDIINVIDDVKDQNSAEEEASSGSDGDSLNNKKSSAYSLAPNKVSCPYCDRKFPWTSSLNRHILTHTGHKPYKCSQCSLWFTTKSNCDRHLIRKHSTINNNLIANSEYKCPLCPNLTFSSLSDLRKHQYVKHSVNMESDEEDFGHEEYEEDGEEEEGVLFMEPGLCETPFKCHLCDDKSFVEREDALQHLQNSHPKEYGDLLEKGVFDSALNETMETATEGAGGDYDQIRGKFPDYVNRKVICLFCMRKFWSAEDLRRHVRTHTGERPYSCDICHRRFTLKHSMLRHRKKHDSGVSSDSESDGSSVNNGREENNSNNNNNNNNNNYNNINSQSQKKRSLMDTINKLSASASSSSLSSSSAPEHNNE